MNINSLNRSISQMSWPECVEHIRQLRTSRRTAKSKPAKKKSIQSVAKKVEGVNKLVGKLSASQITELMSKLEELK